MEALVIENFLERSASQLTYHGLSELVISMEDDEIGVLFRNNHFSTIYKVCALYISFSIRRNVLISLFYYSTKKNFYNWSPIKDSLVNQMLFGKHCAVLTVTVSL